MQEPSVQYNQREEAEAHSRPACPFDSDHRVADVLLARACSRRDSRPSFVRQSRRQLGWTRMTLARSTGRQQSTAIPAAARSTQPITGKANLAAAAQQAHNKTRKIDGVRTSSLRPRRRLPSTVSVGRREGTRELVMDAAKEPLSTRRESA